MKLKPDPLFIYLFINYSCTSVNYMHSTLLIHSLLVTHVSKRMYCNDLPFVNRSPEITSNYILSTEFDYALRSI